MSSSEQHSRSPGGEGEARKKTPPLVIRPDRSYQWPRASLVSARTPWRNALKLGLNVLGVLILIGAAALVLTRVGGGFGDLLRTSACIGEQLCAANGTSSVGSASSSPIAAQSATASRGLASLPTVIAILTPTSGTAPPTPVATPPYAVLKVMPTHAIIAHYPYCSNHKVALVIQLQNVGGQSLVWRQSGKTSPGFSMNVSGNGYLIEPGQTVKVRLSCSPNDTKGQYHVEITYNGGVIDIPIQVTNSRGS
jgi:hypothetical protein